MTVQELIEALGGLHPDMRVAVSCESNGDPHPIVSAGLWSGVARLGTDPGQDWDGDLRAFVEIGANR